MKEKVESLLTMSKACKLLYVEDNQEARESTTLFLKRFFDDITIAVDGQDGLEKFQENKNFELIITDINMPRLNGLDMLSAIKERDSEVLTIVLSAHNEQNFLDRAQDIQVDKYINKPINLPELVEVLLNTLNIKEIA